MDDVFLVDVWQRRADGGRLASQAVIPLHVAPVAGEAGEAATAQQTRWPGPDRLNVASSGTRQ